MKESKDIWFKRKIYGWGWYPCCLNGWMAILGFFIAIVLSSAIISNYMPDEESFVMLFIPVVMILAVIMLIVCLLRGEKPCWSWGKCQCKND